MGSDITLITNTYYKGNYSSSIEFSILQNNKNSFSITLSILAAILLSCYYIAHNENWYPIFYLSLVIFIGVIIIVNILLSIERETVILVVPVAMQLKTTYLSGRQSITSIPWYLLGDLMILDIIEGQQVSFFLAVEVKNSSSQRKHVILFRHTKPRLKYLERIYRDFQEILDTNR